MQTNTNKVLECRQIESREMEKFPPFLKKMLKGGTG
jgi:hypothetical protein